MIDGVEVVFHEAAIPSVPKSMAEPIENHAANATGTLRVLECGPPRPGPAGRLRGVVGGVRRRADLPKVETMPPAPISPYGGTKLAGEQYMQIYAHAYGLETVCLRYFNVFGPRQDPQSEYAAVIPKFITAALAGQRPRIFGDGTQSRDFCHIDNVVEANFKAASADARAVSGGVFNIGCGQATDLNQVVALIGDVLGRKIEPDARGRAGGRHQALLRGHLGGAEATRVHRGGIFRRGLRRTVDWYKKQARA